MTYHSKCAYCERIIGQTRGRPTRWCSPGCKIAGEAEMRRIDRTLRISEEGRLVDRLNKSDTAARDAAMAELRGRYNRLAGVPGADVDTDGGAA